MVIVFHKRTGKIIASFPEAYKLDYHAMQVSSEGEPYANFAHYTLSPEEAYDFNNPYHPANIHDHKLVFDKNYNSYALHKLTPSKDLKREPKIRELKNNLTENS
jgi:hypothetical protein